jgi:hypothetical protein
MMPLLGQKIMDPAFKAGFININGIQSKAENIKNVIIEQKLDIMILVETWLLPSSNSGIVGSVVDVREELRPNSSRGHGGIMVVAAPWLKNHITLVSTSDDKTWVLLKVDTIHLVCGYFPPSYSDEKFCQFWKEVQNMAEEYDNLLVVGDFNARMEMVGDLRNNRRGNWLSNFLSDPSSKLTVRIPDKGRRTTFHPNGGSGITDLVLTQPGSDLVQFLEVQETESVGQSDHRLITGIITWPITSVFKFEVINVAKLNTEKGANAYIEELEKSGEAIMPELLIWVKKIMRAKRKDRSLSWHTRTRFMDEIWNIVKKFITNSLETTCGHAKRVIRINNHFDTNDITELRSEAKLIECQAHELVSNGASKTHIREKYRELGRIRTKLRKRIERRKGTVFRKTIDLLDLPNKVNDFSKMVSAIKRKQHANHNNLDPTKCDTYVEHFSKSFSVDPQAESGTYSEKVLEETSDTAEYCPEIDYLSPEFIGRLIKNCCRSNAPGADSIGGTAIRIGSKSEVFLNIIGLLFACCKNLAVIPSEWRVANIFPLYKNKGDPKDINNYRPISLTCILRRLYERAFLTTWTAKIDKQLTENQYGFRPRRSTIEALGVLHESIIHNEDGCYVFLDLKSAYDVIDRRVLWTILRETFDVSDDDIRVLRSLFDHNSSKVCMGGSSSETVDNLVGLLQGSVLSPILFNCFIHKLSVLLNDAAKAAGVKLGKFTLNHILFADDIVLLTKNAMFAQQCLNICTFWARSVGMRFSPTKCKAIIKGRGGESLANIDENSLPQGLFIQGEPIDCVPDVIHLGVEVGNNGIHWEKSIAMRTQSMIQGVYWLKNKGMNAYGWRPLQSIKVYKSFLRPKLEYVMGLKILTDKELKPIQDAQSFALRKLLSCGPKTSLAAMHLLTGLEPMSFRNHFLNASFINRLSDNRNVNRYSSQICPGGHATIKGKRKGCLLGSVKKNIWKNDISSEGWTKKDIEKRRRGKCIDVWVVKHGGTVSNRIITRSVGLPAKLLLEAGELPRPACYAAMLWRLGRISSYGNCLKCGEQRSRSHMVQCANIGGEIGEILKELNAPVVTFTKDADYVDYAFNIIECTKGNETKVLRKLCNTLLKASKIVNGWPNGGSKEVDIDDEDDNEYHNKALVEGKTSLNVLGKRRKKYYGGKK